MAEEEMKNAFEAKEIKTCSLRVFSAYGPGLKKQLFWDIYQKALQSKTITLSGTGGESRDFIFINDLVQAIDVIISRANFQADVINVASGTETTISNAARIFLDALGKDYSLQFSGEKKVGDPLNWKADITKISEMGFKPFTSVEDGLQKTVQGYETLPKQQ
jgi:UDP-glucose 4-epimerase